MSSNMGPVLRPSRVRPLLGLAFLVALGMAAGVLKADAQTIYDDQTIYGWQTFSGSSGGTCSNNNTVTTYTNWGRRYRVVVKNGATQATKVSLSLDGQEWIGQDEFTSSTDSLTRTIDITHSTEGQSQAHNTLNVCVWGPTGSSVSVRIYHVAEPTFIVYGWHTFNRLDPIADETTPFVNSYSATSPYLLRAINGAGSGTNRVTNATLHLNDSQILGVSDFGTGIATITRDVGLIGPVRYNPQCSCWENDVVDVVRGRNESATGTYFKVQIRGTDATAPSLSVSAPVDTHWTSATSVNVAGTTNDDETKVLVTVSDAFSTLTNGPIRGNGSFADVFNLSVDRLYKLRVRAVNSAGLSTDIHRYVKRDTQAPILDVLRPAATFQPVDSASIAIKVTWSDSILTYITVDGDTVAKDGGSGTKTYQTPSYPLDIGPNRIVFRARDRVGNETTITRFVFRKSPGEGTPPDSVMYPPAINGIQSAWFINQVSWLYLGDTLGVTLQKDVVVDSIRADLAGVARGRVTARDFGAIANVKVRVLGHPEYGYAMTRADGRFDMVVNGGAPLTLRFTKPGYLEAHRVFQVPVGSYAAEDNVALIGKSNKIQWVPFDSLRIVGGRFASDANGDRKLRLLFQPGTVAKIARTTGDTASLGGIRLHITEYTVGPDGPRAMPASLPAASAYTYAVDFTVDEADSIGNILHPELPAPDVLFTKPVVCYVPNFLHLPVGVAVPYGYYDRRGGKWIAERDGWVVRILTNNGTTVTIDSKGNGTADGQARLDSLGISTAELQMLAGQYAAGDTIWREVATRFSNCDFNLLFGFMTGTGPPSLGGAPPNKRPPPPCPRTASGSIINCDDRTLGEQLAITGTPYTLNYQSFRAAGDLLLRSVVVPVLADPLVVAGWNLTKAIVRLEVAGRVYEQTILNPTTSSPPVTLVWDGTDIYGRFVPGSVLARVSLGYIFRTAYGSGNGGRSLDGPGSPGNGQGDATGDRQVERGLWAGDWIFLGVPGTHSDGLGGWTLSPHHVYDSQGSGTVYLGDGSVIRGDLLPNSVRNVSCPPPLGSCPPSPTSLDQIAAYPSAMAFGPDGRFYFANNRSTGVSDYSVYRANANGSSLTRVAGNGSLGTYAGDGPATATPLPHPVRSLAVGPDGSLYLACSNNASKSTTLIAVVTPDGQIRKVIGGNGTSNYGGGDGLPALQAYVGYVASLAVGPEGSLYLLDGGYTDLVHSNTSNVYVRRIGTNGFIVNYAGRGGLLGNSDSTGIATQLPINYTRVIAIDDAGNVYLITPLGVRRIATDGTIRTLMGKPPGASEILTGMVSREGAVYLATSGAGFWRRDPDGTLRRIGGEGSGWSSGSAPVPFTGVSPSIWPYAIAVAPDGNPWLAMSNAILRVDGPFATNSSEVVTIPSPDGGEYYAFTKSGPTAGRHLYTRDALTGAVRFRFGHDQAGQLSRVYDVNGDSTLIDRNGSTTTITAPYGQRTTLTLNGGLLATVANPKNEVITLTTDSNGLLRAYRDPRNNTYTYDYGSDGRLSLDSDPASGSQQLSVTYSGFTQTVTRTTGENRQTTYTATVTSNGTRQRETIGPDQLRTYQSDSTDGRRRIILPDNTALIDSLIPDPRFHMQAPVVARSTERLPSTISRITETKHILSTGFNPPFVAGTWKEEVRVNADGNTFRQNNPLKSEFNSTTRQLTVTTPQGRQTTASVDSAGRPTSITVAGLAAVSRQYDGRGQLTQSQQGGRTWQYAYDDSGRLETVTDPLTRVTHYRYDAADGLIRLELPGNRQVSFDHDGNGNLTGLKPPGRPTHELSYTAVDLADQYRPPTAGLPSSLTQYRHNKDRQLTRIEQPDSGNVTLGYLSNGRLDALTIPRGTLPISYASGTDHRSAIGSPDTVTVSYSYNGALDTASTWSGKVVGSVSVTLNRDLLVWYQRVNGDTVGFSYDNDALLTRAGSLVITRRQDNGLVSGTSIGGGTPVTTSVSHTNVGEPWRVTAKYGSTTLWQATYGRDSLGRITSVTESAQGATDTVFAYAYSDTGFLKTVSVDNVVKERYDYDGNGNRLKFERGSGADTSTATYDDQDRLLRYGGTRYTYTVAGQLSKSKTANDSTLYTYDPLGNLVTVQLPSGDRIDYLVDGRHRRVGRKLNGVLQKKWLYQDQLEPVAELNSSDSLVARFVYGTRAHVPDYMVKGGATYRIVSDHVGSVRLVVKVSDGAVTQRIDYDGYGRIVLDTNPGFQPFGYAGGLWDLATGLVRFGARDYMPAAGRWTAKDPLLHSGGSSNLYSYVENTPTTLIDPSGLQLTPPILMFGDVPPIRPVIPPEILSDAIRLAKPNSEVKLPDGRTVGLWGRDHFSKGHRGQGKGWCPTPHVKEPRPAPPGWEGFPQGNTWRDATLKDILDAIEHLMFGGGGSGGVPALYPYIRWPQGV